jgi:cytochrome c oxidase cbb3-type subunit 3
MKYRFNKSLGITALAVLGGSAYVYGADPDPNLIAKMRLDNLMLIAVTLGCSAVVLLLTMIAFFMVNTKRLQQKKQQSLAQKVAAATTVLLLITFPVLAQTDATAAASAPAYDPTAAAFSLIGWIIIGLAVLNVGLLIGVISGFDYYLRVVHDSSLRQILPDWGLDALFSWDKLTGQKASGKGSHLDTALDHQYDGIMELDNPAPPLFNYILYGTIIFSVVYWTVYHVTDSQPLMEEEYKIAMNEAAEQKAEYMKLVGNMVDENSVKVTTDPVAIADGKSVFMANCAACHGDKGEGKVGPNFCDEYWLHGGGVKDIFKTIKYGVPEKGMIAWEKQLTPGQIANVTNYILTLRGTNPPNAKEPQGEKWTESGSVAPTDSSAKPESKDDKGKSKTELSEK